MLGFALFVGSRAALAQSLTGERPEGETSRATDGIVPIVTEVGRISLSVDGVGTNDATAIVQVNKPNGGVVRSAYLAAASTGFSNYVIPDGDVTINGNSVAWDMMLESSIQSSNHWANVTTIVKPIVDAASAGLVDITIGEANPNSIEGEILIVIFDDPQQSQDNTIVLLFGAQDIDGDTFAIGLSDPIDVSNPNLLLDMGLGISFGCQAGACGNNQVSLIDVNGNPAIPAGRVRWQS